MGGKVHRLEEIVSDFERAMWNAASKVFPHAHIFGCSFHWCQAVFRKIKELGVEPLYRRNPSTYKICRKLLTLNLLPHSKIPKAFAKIEKKASGLLKKLCQYINRQWIISSRFPPSAWSVYGQPIRTNNDAEGWHNRVNRKAFNKAKLSLYELILLMKEEADLVNVQMSLLCQVRILIVFYISERHIFFLFI